MLNIFAPPPILALCSRSTAPSDILPSIRLFTMSSFAFVALQSLRWLRERRMLNIHDHQFPDDATPRIDPSRRSCRR